jgi:hypothetical protein
LLLNQRVVGADGQPVSTGKAILRYLGYIISGVLLSLGFLLAAFDRRRQGLHDKLGGTFVVKADDVIPQDGNVEFVLDDKRGWVWLAIWMAIALLMPAALFSSLLVLGPVMSTTVTEWIRGLF